MCAKTKKKSLFSEMPDRTTREYEKKIAYLSNYYTEKI